MSYFDTLIEQGKTDPVGAAVEMTIGLMRGDRESLKLGYSFANALLAATDRFGVNIFVVADKVVDKIGEHYSATPRPLVIVNITGGVEYWTVTSPGLGEPDVHIFDFDDEMPTDDLERTVERWKEVIELARNRVPAETLTTMEGALTEMEADITSRNEAEAAMEAASERRSKRERAAALLSDTEIDGILDAHNAWPVDHAEGE